MPLANCPALVRILVDPAPVERFVQRVVQSARHCGQDVATVNDQICREFDTARSENCRERVDGNNGFVRYRSGRYAFGPSKQEWHSDPTLLDAVLVVSQRAVRRRCTAHSTIVGKKDGERVVGEAEAIQCVENLAYALVHDGQHGEVGVACSVRVRKALDVVIWCLDWIVDGVIGHVHKKRVIAVRLNECNCFAVMFRVR